MSEQKAPVTVKQLRALRMSIAASLAQVDSMIETATGVSPAELPPGSCPRCGAGPEKLAAAGDVEVCAECGANIKGGEVIGG